MRNTHKPLPCPFCGASPEVLRGVDHNHRRFTQVACMADDCFPRPFVSVHDSKAAFLAWNTRRGE